MAFTMLDGSDYITACFLFIHWAVDSETKVFYMSFNAIYCIKRSKYMGFFFLGGGGLWFFISI